MRTIGSLIQTGRSIHVKRSPPAALQPSGLSNRHCFCLFCEIGKRFQKAAIMFPAGIYYVQTRGCASSVRAGFSLLTGSVIYAYRRAALQTLTRTSVVTFSFLPSLASCRVDKPALRRNSVLLISKSISFFHSLYNLQP